MNWSLGYGNLGKICREYSRFFVDTFSELFSSVCVIKFDWTEMWVVLHLQLDRGPTLSSGYLWE